MSTLSTSPAGIAVVRRAQSSLHSVYQALRCCHRGRSGSGALSGRGGGQGEQSKTLQRRDDEPDPFIDQARNAAKVATGLARHGGQSMVPELRSFVPHLLKLAGEAADSPSFVSAEASAAAAEGLAAIAANSDCHAALLQHGAPRAFINLMRCLQVQVFARQPPGSCCASAAGAGAEQLPRSAAHLQRGTADRMLVAAARALSGLLGSSEGRKALQKGKAVISGCAALLRLWCATHGTWRCGGSCPGWGPKLAALLALLKSLVGVQGGGNCRSCTKALASASLATPLAKALRCEWPVAADAAAVFYALAEDPSGLGLQQIVKSATAMTDLISLAERAIIVDDNHFAASSSDDAAASRANPRLAALPPFPQ